MDPQLAELVDDGEPDDPVAVLVRLEPGADLPAAIIATAAFDRVVTARVRRRHIVGVRAHRSIASIKAPEYLVPEPVELPETAAPAAGASDVRRPEVAETGRGVVLAFIDWGFDFAHPDFRHPDGTTRLLALWDQRGGHTAGSPPPYGYGTVHTPAAVNAALRSSTPYRTLGYHPADADPGGGAHGTHCASIAAGNGRGGGPVGVAPEADIVFVHLTSGASEGLHGLGDSVTLLEALDYVLRIAAGRPVAISLSMGNHGGPHDGSTLVEQAIDAAVGRRPGIAVAQSCGNYFSRPIHASGLLRPGATANLDWTVDAADVTPNELEVWYPGVDVFGVVLTAPGGARAAAAPLGGSAPVMVGGREVGHLYHRSHEPNNGRNHVNVFLYTNAQPGNWRLTLGGDDVADGQWHSWVERDAACPHCQSLLRADETRPTVTTGTVANGFRTIAVGAYDAQRPDRPLAPFSSSGPTVDGRTKPDIVARGVNELAARSAPRGAVTGAAATTRMSGTSMAAPHVAGTIALMFEAAGQLLPIDVTRRLLFRTAEVYVADTAANALRAGDGYLAPVAAVEAARNVHPAQTPAGSVVREAESITAAAAEPAVETAPSYTLPPDPAQLRPAARTQIRATPIFPADRVLDIEANLISSIAARPDGWVYMLNWHAEHDMTLPSGARFSTVLSDCARAGGTIRALIWSGGVPDLSGIRSTLLGPVPSLLMPVIGPAIDEIVRRVVAHFFSSPLLNRHTVDFISSLPHASALLDDATLSFGSHHHKVLVVGNNETTVAVLGGVDWNTDRLVVDPHQAGTPLFDVSVQVDGQAAVDVAEVFEARWRANPRRAFIPLPVRRAPTVSPPATGATVQVGVNYGCGMPLTSIRRRIYGADQMIEHLLDSCQDFFYAEDQYGTGNLRLRDSINRAFQNGARFGVVVLANTQAVGDLPEIAYRRWNFWHRFPQIGRSLFVFDRAGDNGSPTGPHAYVHSKLMLVDDRAASIGTVNLNRRSWYHDSEITATLTDAPDVLRDFRLNLWPYHLTLGAGDDIRDLARAQTLWSDVYRGARRMPRLTPIPFPSTPPPRESARLTPILSPLVPVPDSMITAAIDQIMDTLFDTVLDPVGPISC